MAERKNTFLVWIVYTAVLLGLTFLTSYFPLWANVPVNVIAPLVVLIVCRMVMFERLKLSTLILLRVAIVFVIFNLLDGTLFTKIVLAFLIINIFEATFTDLLKNKQPYNFVTGLILGISVLCLSGTWIPEFAGPFTGIYRAEIGGNGSGLFASDQVFIFGTVCWILAYTFWNWLFVVGEFSPSVAYAHIGILLTPILGSLITMTPGFWLVFRANSLTTGGVFQIAFKSREEKMFKSDKMAAFCGKVKTKKVQVAMMIVNLVLMAVPITMFFAGKGF